MAAMPDVIEAHPLILSRWRAEDVDDVLSAVQASFHELRQWMDWAQTMPSRDEQREVLATGHDGFDAGTDFGYVLRESSSGELVGGAGAHRRIGPGAVEIGYWVRSDRHNRGYATTAAAALTDAVFDWLADVERIEIHMDCANVASARVPDKLGYRRLRTEPREKRAAAHTGQAFVWQTTRTAWTTRSRPST
jgi:RimJ/RimL family protein N-acetyltransferase